MVSIICKASWNLRSCLKPDFSWPTSSLPDSVNHGLFCSISWNLVIIKTIKRVHKSVKRVLWLEQFSPLYAVPPPCSVTLFLDILSCECWFLLFVDTIWFSLFAVLTRKTSGAAKDTRLHRRRGRRNISLLGEKLNSTLWVTNERALRSIITLIIGNYHFAGVTCHPLYTSRGVSSSVCLHRKNLTKDGEQGWGSKQQAE